MPQKPWPVLARRIFWDLDFTKLDYEVDDVLIIERVFSWGDLPDLREARRYYGDERICTVLLASDEIPFVALGLISAMFDRPMEDFKSFSKGVGKDPYLMKREYLDELQAVHGLPPLPPPDPILMRMS